MAFVDEITLTLKAGDGGNGVVRWLHLKGKEFSGPAGGDGGDGGDVIMRAARDLAVLSRYVGSTKMSAEDGEDGRGKNQFGKKGEDRVIDIPIGAIVTRESDGMQFELLEEGEEILVLKGGRGGLGNTNFKSSTNINPMEQTDGRPGEESRFLVELRLIADIGLVGLPNAGKSSLLNALTNARSAVANYNFTTLEPHLGEFYGYIIADIPGLIEGASGGKGLGHKFLRHVRRTKELLHCISVENEDVKVAYDTIRGELEKFDPEMLEKEEVVLLTKIDEATDEQVAEKVRVLEEHTGKKVIATTILDDDNIKQLRDILVRSLGSD